MTFPRDDQYEDDVIDTVSKDTDGWSITKKDGWSFFIPSSSPVEPQPGMTVRMYSRGMGYPVRGVYLDGVKVYYRTATEEAEHREIESYGRDAADWLARWDAGKGVWSIEMGGLGPGYEQAIQMTAAEVLRHLLDAKYDHAAWSDTEVWQRDRKAIETAGFSNEIIKALGLSGAQWGAAVSIATKLYMDGPRKIMNEPSIKDRHIQVSRTFPGMAA